MYTGQKEPIYILHYPYYMYIIVPSFHTGGFSRPIVSEQALDAIMGYP